MTYSGMNKLRWASLGILLVAFAVAGCYKESEEHYFRYSSLSNNVPCDTSNITYSQSVVKVMQDNCYRCHSSATRQNGGGLSYETYAELKTVVDTGELIGCVTHAAGYRPMPNDMPTQKIPDCQIAILQKWVAAGAPNN